MVLALHQCCRVLQDGTTVPLRLLSMPPALRFVCRTDAVTSDKRRFAVIDHTERCTVNHLVPGCHVGVSIPLSQARPVQVLGARPQVHGAPETIISRT